MSGTKEKTVHTCCPECDIGPFTRNHYFTGKLLVERDFRQEQAYYMDKLRLHTQRLHGWGVVCGLKVKQHETPACRNRFVCIEPGLAIDCCGHDIFVPEEDCIDLTQFDSVKALLEKKDPNTHTLQIRICYKECPSEPIPVLYDDCGCDDTQCAPNRILESYEVDVTVVDPATTTPSPEAPGASETSCCDLQWKSLDGCPPCDTGNCVVLATIVDYVADNAFEDLPSKPDDAQKNISRIDNRAGRRLLPSTSTLAEIIQCICDTGGGGQGTKGDTGPQGPRGVAGPGIDQVSVDFVTCDEPGAAQIERLEDGSRQLDLKIPSCCNQDLAHICAINWNHADSNNPLTFKDLMSTGLLIAFDQGVNPADINSTSVRVLAQMQGAAGGATAEGFTCWCELSGNLQPIDFDPPLNMDPINRTCTITANNMAKPPVGDQAHGVQFKPAFIPPFQGALLELRVIVLGDLIRSIDSKGKSRGVDANHLPEWLPKRPTGDGIEGGEFISTLFVGQ